MTKTCKNCGHEQSQHSMYKYRWYCGANPPCPCKKFEAENHSSQLASKEEGSRNVSTSSTIHPEDKGSDSKRKASGSFNLSEKIEETMKKMYSYEKYFQDGKNNKHFWKNPNVERLKIRLDILKEIDKLAGDELSK